MARFVLVVLLTSAGGAAAQPGPTGDLAREVDRLRTAIELNESHVNRILTLMEVFVGFLGAVLVVAGVVAAVVGVSEWKQVRDLRNQAAGKLKEAEDLLVKSREASGQIQLIRTGISASWNQIDEHLSTLGAMEFDMVLGLGARQVLPATARSRFEDADTILIVADRLNLQGDAPHVASHFIAMARFWRRIDNHARSIDRLERACVLAPDMETPMIELAKGLALWAETEAKPSTVRSDRLVLALDWATRAKAMRRTWQAHHARGWVLDSLERWGEAVDEYDEARRMCLQEAGTAAIESSRNITYNLACTLAKEGRRDQALDELAKVINHDENWLSAPQDGDFASLWADPRFKQLVDAATRR